jgi:hypothetical protein
MTECLKAPSTRAWQAVSKLFHIFYLFSFSFKKNRETVALPHEEQMHGSRDQLSRFAGRGHSHPSLRTARNRFIVAGLSQSSDDLRGRDINVKLAQLLKRPWQIPQSHNLLVANLTPPQKKKRKRKEIEKRVNQHHSFSFLSFFSFFLSFFFFSLLLVFVPRHHLDDEGALGWLFGVHREGRVGPQRLDGSLQLLRGLLEHLSALAVHHSHLLMWQARRRGGEEERRRRTNRFSVPASTDNSC